MTELKKNKFGWRDLFRLVCFVGSIGLCWGGYLLIKYFWVDLGISFGEGAILSVNQLVILPWFVMAYCLMGFAVVCFVALKKRGFKNLKPWNKKGLIFGLIAGLIRGLIFGLIAGLIVGLIAGLIRGLIFELIVGLIFGLIVGLIFELIVKLINGLIDEFKK